jgi:hypothetical protein
MNHDDKGNLWPRALLAAAVLMAASALPDGATAAAPSPSAGPAAVEAAEQLRANGGADEERDRTAGLLSFLDRTGASTGALAICGISFDGMVIRRRRQWSGRQTSGSRSSFSAW